MRLAYRSLSILALVGALTSLTGCPAALVGGGAAGGYALSEDKGPAGRYTDDAVITSKVKSKLLADSDVKSFNISVNTTERVVSLTGKVPSLAMKLRAVNIAAKTEGVLRVDAHNLQIRK